MKNRKIAFIGTGNMASAMINGLLKNNFPTNNITATNKTLSKLDHLNKNIHKTTDNNAAIKEADVIVLAVKPQTMQECIKELNISHNPLIISIAAGTTVASLENWLKKPLPIVRCMPNMPAIINQGATGLFANSQVSTEQKKLAEQILQSIGITTWLKEESQIDIVIAIAASAPAYYFYLMEILQEFAAQHGMDSATANTLIRQTCAGSGTLALHSAASNRELMQQIMSKGGTTEAMIDSLKANDFAAVMQQALKALMTRSQEIAKN